MTAPMIFSERPGFTHVGGLPTDIGPVVARLDGSRNSFMALRAAVGHAMTRTCEMVVLDETGEPGFPFSADVIDERERSVAAGILGNNHVSRLRVESPGLGEAIRRSVDLNASLLVLNADDVARAMATPDILAALLDTPCDVLMLAPGTMRNPG
ncbi:MAG TPA: hypothetical protein VF115_12955 [Acidimicrobiia bacterium]